MQLSYKNKKHNKIDYFILPNGNADVFLHKNEFEEVDSEGNTRYVAEEVYFQVEQTITKEQIENNFDFMWNDAENVITEPAVEERLQALEMLELERLLGGM